jgi:hypothetical protein
MALIRVHNILSSASTWSRLQFRGQGNEHDEISRQREQ